MRTNCSLSCNAAINDGTAALAAVPIFPKAKVAYRRTCPSSSCNAALKAGTAGAASAPKSPKTEAACQRRLIS